MTHKLHSGEPFFFYRFFVRSGRFHFLFLRDSIRENGKDFFQLDMRRAVLQSAVRFGLDRLQLFEEAS